MSGRKVFTAGEVLQAADVNDFLMDQSVMVFAGSAARGSAIPSPSEGMMTYLEDSDQVQVYNGSSFGPIGTILQVVSTTKTDTFSTSATSFTDITGLSATITPSSTSSKILVMASLRMTVSPDTQEHQVRLVRDSTPIFVGDAAGSRTQVSAQDTRGSVTHGNAATPIHLDSPNTTSAVTYKMQASSDSSTFFLNRGRLDADNYQYSRSASSITLMEVAG